VRGLDRRRVVDAVARHRDHVALPFERVDEQHLVLRSDPSDDADPIDPREPLGLVERGELRAEDRLPLGTDCSTGSAFGPSRLSSSAAFWLGSPTAGSTARLAVTSSLETPYQGPVPLLRSVSGSVLVAIAKHSARPAAP